MHLKLQSFCSFDIHCRYLTHVSEFDNHYLCTRTINLPLSHVIMCCRCSGDLTDQQLQVKFSCPLFQLGRSRLIGMYLQRGSILEEERFPYRKCGKAFAHINALCYRTYHSIPCLGVYKCRDVDCVIHKNNAQHWYSIFIEYVRQSGIVELVQIFFVV